MFNKELHPNSRVRIWVGDFPNELKEKIAYEMASQFKVKVNGVRNLDELGGLAHLCGTQLEYWTDISYGKEHYEKSDGEYGEEIFWIPERTVNLDELC